MRSLMGYRLASMIEKNNNDEEDGSSKEPRGVIEYIRLSVKDLVREKQLFLSFGLKVISETVDEVTLWSGKGPYLILKKGNGLPGETNPEDLLSGIQLGISLGEITSTRRKIARMGYQVIETLSDFFKRKEYALMGDSGADIHFFRRPRKKTPLD